MKLLLLTFSFFFIFTLLPHQTFAACSGFADVDENIWYCDVIGKLRIAGVIQTHFKFFPDQIMTRDQAMKVIYEIAGKDIPEYSESFFDISSDSDSDWYRKYFAHAYGAHVIALENGKFNPGKAISKSEFLVLLLKTFDVTPEASTCNIPVNSSIPRSSWLASPHYTAYLCTALTMGIAKSAYDDQTITRAVAMQMIYNAMK